MSTTTVLPKICVSKAEEYIEDAEKLESLLRPLVCQAADLIPREWIKIATRENLYTGRRLLLAGNGAAR